MTSCKRISISFAERFLLHGATRTQNHEATTDAPAARTPKQGGTLKKQGRTLIFREASLFFQSPLPLISAVLQAILPISCGSTKALPKMTGRAAGFAHSRENRNVRESSFRHAGRFSYYNCDSITAFLLFPTNRLFVEAPSCLIFYILSFSANPVLRIPPPRPVQKKAYVLPLIEKSYVNL